MTREVDDLFEDEVTTGATLDTNTTVGGNTAFHLGNDGQGSGLDAETVDGSDVAVTGDNWTLTKESDALGTVKSGFASPGVPYGVGVAQFGNIWHGTFEDCIYELSESGDVLTQFASPCGRPFGVGLDSSDSLWVTTSNTDSIHELTQSGNDLGGFSSPSQAPYGVGVDSNDCIWNTDATSATPSIYQLTQQGNIEGQFASPSEEPRGIDFDSSDCLWVGINSTSIYKMNKSGTIQTQFKTPSNLVQGVGVDGSDSLWVASNGSDSIYEITSGSETYSLNTKQ